MKVGRKLEQGDYRGQNPLEELAKANLPLEPEFKIDGYHCVRFLIHRLNLPSPTAEGDLG